MADLCLGIARARLGPAAALISPAKGIAACEENRLTRARQAATSGPPELAIQELLAYLGGADADIHTVAVVKDEDQTDWWRGAAGATGRTATREFLKVNAHQAHAEYAFRGSGFDTALVVVCDASVPAGYTAQVSGVRDQGSGIREQGSTTKVSKAGSLESVGRFHIARIYSALTAALGLQPARDEHLVEAMARAGDASRSSIGEMIELTADGIAVREDFQQAITKAIFAPNPEAVRRNIAAAVQQKLGRCLDELLRRLAKQTDARRLCLSGGLFFNTHFTTMAAACEVFDDTYLPPHAGRGGSALGAALLAPDAKDASDVGSPYLGPGYSDAQVKEALENCKLSYDLQREDQVIDTVLRALSRGRLVGWFHGRLEWGPRALGHRTVLADPFSAHVLDNLNGYLKKRPAYRSYGVSVPRSKLQELFEGPKASPFMQYEYRPRDPEKFRAILPQGVKTLRVHSVDESEPRYLRLLERWGEMSGTPVLVNTSFNGFHEPLVCSPRDAIRVFYGTGLDLLALEDFVLRK